MKKVRYWCSDHQGGGWVDWVTVEESERRDALKAKAERGDLDAADQIDWEEWSPCYDGEDEDVAALIYGGP